MLCQVCILPKQREMDLILEKCSFVYFVFVSENDQVKE